MKSFFGSAAAPQFVAAVGARIRANIAPVFLASLAILTLTAPGLASAASPCDAATHPNQCGWFDAAGLPPFVYDAIVAKGGVPDAGNVLVLTSGDPLDQDSEISNDMAQAGCGTNPDGWETYDCNLLDQFVPAEDSVVLALSSEWFEWYQTIYTDWMTISGAGLATVDVSINSWINSKVDVIPYGPQDTGTVILTSLSAAKMVNFRVADSGDHIYDTAIVVVPATWFAALGSTDSDATLLCGNDVLEPGEDCDDGNHITDDGCSSLCLGTQPAPTGPPPTSATCGNLFYVWPNGASSAYTCGADLCGGFRCVVGDTISPACYTADQCAAACAGSCVDVQTAQLDCSTMCGVQPPANQPPPVLPQSCTTLSYEWADGTTMPYTCDDPCQGQRCVSGSSISPECYGAGECNAATCPEGTCVGTPAADCAALCAMGEQSQTCTPAEKDSLRVAANQQGACLGSMEMCSGAGFWETADGYYTPVPESCNGIDDDCNGIVDDMFVTCGDPGLCQNTINTCDPANPSVPVVCQPLTPPSPVEICNDGLDNDCDGAADDGCHCGDNECMPGEDFLGCPNDCPAPANGTPCDDGDLCTSGESWQSGACTGGAALSCDDGNACVVNPSCDPAVGCTATKVDCNDGIGCTEDTCDTGAGCVNTPVDSLCDDGDPCTIDTCGTVTGCGYSADPTCGGTDADSDGYIAVAYGGDDCNDGDASVHPGATEYCNGVDDDCNTIVDDGFGAGGACQSAPNDCGSSTAGTLVCTPDGLSVACDAVTPANPAGYGDACTSTPNACGDTASGTVQCNGSCDAVTPADPAGYGDACTSAANACGDTASGTVQCNGSCDAVTPTPVDSDSDNAPDCLDGCPDDPDKTAPAVCGCGVADIDSNSNTVIDCQETVFADLAAAVTQRNRVVRAGRRLKYSITVSNLGPDSVDAASVQAVISGDPVSGLRLPRGCSGTVAAITCDVGRIVAGRRRARVISVIPSAGTTVTVTATASSALLDLDAGNQTASATTLVP